MTRGKRGRKMMTRSKAKLLPRKKLVAIQPAVLSDEDDSFLHTSDLERHRRSGSGSSRNSVETVHTTEEPVNLNEYSFEKAFRADDANPLWSIEVQGFHFLPLFASIEQLKRFSESCPEVRQIRWDNGRFIFETSVQVRECPSPPMSLITRLQEYRTAPGDYEETIHTTKVSQILWTR